MTYYQFFIPLALQNISIAAFFMVTFKSVANGLHAAPLEGLCTAPTDPLEVLYEADHMLI